jgi:hypothetical protein
MDKPPHGLPCNGCGKCCETILCPLAFTQYHYWQGPCPALTPTEDGKKICGLITDPELYFPARVRRWGLFKVKQATSILIGSGMGCDARVEGEPINTEFKARAIKYYETIKAEIRQAKIVWGIKN